MINVYYSIESQCKSDIVTDSMTLKEFCETHGIPTARQLILNGTAVNGNLDTPLKEFADASNMIDMTVCTKMQNA